MYVLLSYDIGTKRVSKALKACRRYLTHVHRSVFEGEITEARLRDLKRELERVVDVRHDSVCIWRVAAPRFMTVERIELVEDADEIV